MTFPNVLFRRGRVSAPSGGASTLSAFPGGEAKAAGELSFMFQGRMGERMFQDMFEDLDSGTSSVLKCSF